MSTSQSCSKNRHIQLFRDSEREERVLAHVETDNRWINGFLVRLASVVQNLGPDSKGVSRPD
jgi:hypothetical protein